MESLRWRPEPPAVERSSISPSLLPGPTETESAHPEIWNLPVTAGRPGSLYHGRELCLLTSQKPRKFPRWDFHSTSDPPDQEMW